MDDSATPDWGDLHNSLVGSLTSPQFMDQHPQLPAGPPSANEMGDRYNLDGPLRHFQGDSSIRTFAHDVGDAYEQGMTGAGVPAELARRYRPQVEKEAGDKAKEYALDKLTASSGLKTTLKNLPVVHSIAGSVEQTEQKKSDDAIRAGRGTLDDYINAGQARQNQSDDEKRGFWGTAGKMALGGANLGIDVALSGGLAGAATKTGAAALGAGKAVQWGASVLGTAAGTPGLWVERATRDNLAAGRDPLDPRGVPGPMLLSAAQLAAFGAVSRFTGGWVSGSGPGAAAGRAGVAAGAGFLAVPATDALLSAAHLDTGYGALGKLVRGDPKGALADATRDAVMFAAFSLAHEIGRPATPTAAEPPPPTAGALPAPEAPPEGPRPGGPPPEPPEPPEVIKAFTDALKDGARRGYPWSVSTRRVQGVMDDFKAALAKNRDLTRDQAAKLFEGMTPGKLRDFGMALADTRPEAPPEAAEAAPEPPPQAAQEAPPAAPQPQGEPEPAQAPPAAAQAPPEQPQAAPEAPALPDALSYLKDLPPNRQQRATEGYQRLRRQGLSEAAAARATAQAFPPPAQPPAQPVAQPPAAAGSDQTAPTQPETGQVPIPPVQQPAGAAEVGEAAKGTAPGETPPPPSALDQLRARYQADPDSVKLQDVYDAAGLSPLEQHVLKERLAGRSHQQIAGDKEARKPDGTLYTRQRLAQIEGDAVVKLGGAASIADAVHAQQKVEGGLDKIEDGKGVAAKELHGDPATQRVGKKRLDAFERTEAEIDRLLASHERGEMTDEQLKAELDRIGQQLEGKNRPAQGPAPEVPEPGAGPPPLRRGATAGLPPGPPEPAPALEGAGAPAPAHAGGEAAAAGREAAGNKLTSAQKAHREVVERRFPREFRDYYEAGIDIERLHDRAAAIMARYGIKPGRSMGQQGDEYGAYRQAGIELAQEKQNEAQREAAAAGHTPAEIAQAVSDGQGAALAEARGKGFPVGGAARGGEPPADSTDPEGRGDLPSDAGQHAGDFDFGANRAGRPVAGGGPGARRSGRGAVYLGSGLGGLQQLWDNAMVPPDPRIALGAGSLRHRNAEKVARHDRDAAALASGEHFFQGYIEAQKPDVRKARFLAFFAPIEAGHLSGVPPEQRPFAQAYRDLHDEYTKLLVKHGLVQEWIENHVGHLWRDPRNPKASASDIAGTLMGRRPLAGREGFRRERTIPTYADGIAAGLEPVHWNPMTQARLEFDQYSRSLFGAQVRADMTADGVRLYVPLSAGPPMGWVRGEDKYDTVFVHPNSSAPQLVGHYYYPPEVARLIHNHVMPGLASAPGVMGLAFRAFRGIGNQMSQFLLGTSGLHAVGTALNSQFSAIAEGMGMLTRGDFLQAIKNPDAVLPGVAAARAVAVGAGLRHEWDNPGSGTPEQRQMVEWLKEGGARARGGHEYVGNQVAATTRALRMIAAGKYGMVPEVMARAIPAINQLFAKPTMEFVVPLAKLSVAADAVRYEMAKNPAMDLAQRREVFGKIWDQIDDRFGLLTYDNMFWNRVVRDIFQTIMLSFGWNWGDVRGLGGGAIDLLRPSQWQGLSKGEGMSRRTAFLIAMMAGSAVYGALYQLAATGEAPKEAKDMWFPRNGQQNRDGTAARVSLPTYMKDLASISNRVADSPFQVGRNAWGMFKAKMSPALRLTGELLDNQDWSGAAIDNPNDPWTTQSKDNALHILKAFEPISVSQFSEQREKGAGVGQQVQGFFGITPAPSRITHTDEELRWMEQRHRWQMSPQERRRMGLR